jgi:diacylglycerol kinase (ATP)
VQRIYRATLNSFRGLAHAARTENAFREELVLLALALLVAPFVAPSVGWYVAMIGALPAILAVELLNTAIEKLADHVSPEWRTNIGLIKDCGAAAVFCALCLAGLVWLAALALRLGLV